MEDSSLLIWGTLFGAVGFGFFLYGRKQKAAVPLLAGMALMVIPFFISNVYLLIISGVALMAIPYFVRI